MWRKPLLPPDTDPRWPRGYGYRRFGLVASTMDTAKTLIDSGEYGPIWLHADRQVKGRGRRGRSWQDPDGNLISTLLLPTNGRSPHELSLISFVAALAIHSLCQNLIGTDATVELKWPNDVLINGRKVSGILLENHAPFGLAVGIGMNVSTAIPQNDPQAAFAPISLREIDPNLPAVEEMMLHMAIQFHSWLERFDQNGFAPIRDAWLERAYMPAGPIIARLPNEDIQGEYVGLAMDGCLILRAKTGVRQIAAGDIYW